MTRADFLKRVNRKRDVIGISVWRYGQTVFNLAYENWPKEVYATIYSIDPFYNDENVPAFLDALQELGVFE